MHTTIQRPFSEKFLEKFLELFRISAYEVSLILALQPRNKAVAFMPKDVFANR